MEKEINIAEILKNKPKGTRLYSPIFGECAFSLVREETDDICVKKHNGKKAFFDSKGLYNALGECLLFPSREMRDWSKFAWKKGDVLISDCGFVCIFKEWASDDYTKFNGCYFDGMPNAETAKYSKLDNNTAYGYVRELENRCGGKLNLDTLEIEKTQPEFKDGDIVCISGMGYLTYGVVKSIDNSSKKLEYYVLNDMSTLKFEDWLSFEDKQIQPITETQQIILFDALAKDGKAWDADKKMIIDLKQKVELKPFDKVLVRDSQSDKWRVNLFGYIDKDEYYHCAFANWVYCIPYAGNEHLLGTTKDVEG